MKITGKDVVASNKVIYGIMLITILSCIFAVVTAIRYYFETDSFIDLGFLITRDIIFWAFYFYIALIFSDRTVMYGRRVYFNVLSICTPTYIHTLRLLRQKARENVMQMVSKYANEIFPNLAVPKDNKRREMNVDEIITSSFAILSEIGM